MKKLFFILSAVFAVGISSLLLLTPADKNISFLFQHFLPAKESSVPLVLVYADDDFLSQIKSNKINPNYIEKISNVLNEMGAFLTLSDFSEENPLVNIDSYIKKERDTIPQAREMAVINAKIVFPDKANKNLDKKTPEIKQELFLLSDALFSNVYSAGRLNHKKDGDFPYSWHFLFKKNNSYFADRNLVKIFGKLLSSNDNSVEVSDDEIVLNNIKPDEKMLSNDLVIPRSSDGSVILSYPHKSWKEYKSLSVSELYKLSALEENFFKYLIIMEERGLFGELNSENPIKVYESAIEAKEKPEVYFKLLKRFHLLINAYLTGNQETILCESVSDEGRKKIVKNSFTTCRKLYSEIKILREKLYESINGACCILALTSPSSVEFVKTPFDKSFPETLVYYVIANMIFSGNFIKDLAPFVSILVSILFVSIFALLAYRIRKRSLMILTSCLMIFLLVLYAVLPFCLMEIFVGLATPLFSVFVLALLLSFFIFREELENVRKFQALFLQKIDKKSVRKILESSSNIRDGNKIDLSLLTVSISNYENIKKLLNYNQQISFLNYYYDLICSQITGFNGVVESYRGDEVVSLFGFPFSDENYCQLASRAAIAIKKNDRLINNSIRTYPVAPKKDDMDDDLYTAFFILSNRKVIISTKIGIYTGKITLAKMGFGEKKHFQIADDSWISALAVMRAADLADYSGILIDKESYDYIKEYFVIRKLGINVKNTSVPIYEILADRKDDDEKNWNYANYWNQAMNLLQAKERKKALAVFTKLSEGRPGDKFAKYFIKSLNSLE